MATTTTNALDALLYIRNGYEDARWNFPEAEGSTNANTGVGTGVTLSYSFATSPPPYSLDGFQAFDDLQMLVTRWMLDAVAEVVDITFVETAPGTGEISFGNSYQPGSGGFAYAPSFFHYRDSANEYVVGAPAEASGDVWMNRDDIDRPNYWLPGDYGYMALFHELGHALGLRHPFDNSAEWKLDPSLDDQSYTVMSYTAAPRTAIVEVSGHQFEYSWQQSDLRPTTLMPMDIEALQYLYGANTATRSGNTIYTWSTNEEILETLWDGGGIDTIDASNQIFTNVIDLRAGSYSSISLRQTDEEIRIGLSLPDWFDEPLPADIYDASFNMAIADGVVIENAIGGSAADVLRGNSAVNRLTGGAGNDTMTGDAGNDFLQGDAGSDSMSGGTGNDTYYVDTAGDSVVEAASAGTDLVYSSASTYTLTANVENGRITTGGSASITGNTLANVLYAGNGVNSLNGGTGVDTVSFYYAGAGVTASLATGRASGGSGNDTFSGFERLAGSLHADKLTGDGAANQLFGYAGNDVVDGGAGNDVMAGGAGDDTYYVRDAGDVVTELAGQGTDQAYSYLTSHTLGAEVERGRILLAGTASLTGNALDNLLYAGAGNNTIDGGAGIDRVSYIYTTGDVGVTINLSTGSVTGGSGTDTLVGVEGVYGTNQVDSLTGNSAANYLAGHAGNDVINGALGRDTMAGGAGNDTYSVSDATDIVSELANEGTDLVLSYVAQHTLAANVEGGRIRYTGTGTSTLTGNTLDNLLYASSGDNVLSGGTGIDTVSYLYGVAGTTGVTASLASTAVQATAGSGNDRFLAIENLTGSSYADNLTGSSGANTLSGGIGNDTLAGGAGRDVLIGGTGNDLFDFNVVADSGTAATTRDIVNDFVRGQDRVDLSGIDARTGTTANEAFSFIGNAAFGADATGQLRFAYDSASASVILYGSNDADAAAEFSLQLSGLTTVSASNFLL